MELPTKINHSFLKETIIEIRYNSDIETELVNGYVFEMMKKLGYSIKINRLQLPSDSGVQVQGDPVFVDKNISVKFNVNSVVFNTHGEYPLWKEYFTKISKLIYSFSDLNLFKSFQRIGVRYINVFENINIFEIVNQNFRLKIPGKQTINTHVKTEIIEEGLKAIINIGNGRVVQSTNNPGSVFDIDVILELSNINDVKELLRKIDFAHNKEKEVFFTYLNKEFIEKLNPKY